MVVVVVTGGIGSGKSTVTGMLKELGAHVIDWDVLAREVVRPGLKAWQDIVEYFGREILHEDQTINRQKLAEVVFGNAEKVKKLDQITHMEIYKEDQTITDEIKNSDPDAVIVKDIPLMGESLPLRNQINGFEGFMDKVVVVYASRRDQLERLQEKGYTLEDAQKRISSQMPLEEKIKLADFVIYNDGSREETKKQVETLYDTLRKGEHDE